MTNTTTRNIPFDKQAESYQVGWRRRRRLAEDKWGWQNGVQREHILPARQWLLGVWPPIRNTLNEYIHASKIQPNAGKHNLKSSWTQCANFFFPFRSEPRMAAVLTGFLAQQLGVKVAHIESLELEYAAPGNLEPKRLLGELGGKRGSNQTSPDVAILFGCEDGKSGIYLIENKYTEHSFYDCSGAQKILDKTHSERGLPPDPDPNRCCNAIQVLKNPEEVCQQQTWGRKYWSVLRDTANGALLQQCGHCPALAGGYQLFRQQALAKGIANSGLFDCVISGVAYDSRNTSLITCLRSIGLDNFASGWRRLFNTNVRFHCFTHQDFVSYARQSNDKFCQKWAEYIIERYDYK
jgi:hypothetical protein